MYVCKSVNGFINLSVMSFPWIQKIPNINYFIIFRDASMLPKHIFKVYHCCRDVYIMITCKALAALRLQNEMRMSLGGMENKLIMKSVCKHPLPNDSVPSDFKELRLTLEINLYALISSQFTPTELRFIHFTSVGVHSTLVVLL